MRVKSDTERRYNALVARVVREVVLPQSSERRILIVDLVTEQVAQRGHAVGEEV